MTRKSAISRQFHKTLIGVGLLFLSLYCFLHFGKPELEAISAIFGGYILGVIALETRSIFGGVILHIGVAWMMELFGYLQKKY